MDSWLCNYAEHPVGHQHICVCVYVCVCDKLDGLLTVQLWWASCGPSAHMCVCTHACVCVCDELDGLNWATLVSILWAISTYVCVYTCMCVCVCDELDGLNWATLVSILWAISTCTCVYVCVCVTSWMDSTVQLWWASCGPSAHVRVCVYMRMCVCVCVCVCVMSWMDSTVILVSILWAISTYVHVCVCVCTCACLCVWWIGRTRLCNSAEHPVGRQHVYVCVHVCVMNWMDSWLCNSVVHLVDHQHVCVFACVCVHVMSWMDSWPPRLNILQMADRQSNRPAICNSGMYALGDVGNVVIFQCKVWRFVSGSRRKHHLSSPITVFLKSTLFSSSFLWKTRTNAKPLISPLVIQSRGTDFSLTLCSICPSEHVTCSQCYLFSQPLSQCWSHSTHLYHDHVNDQHSNHQYHLYLV